MSNSQNNYMKNLALKEFNSIYRYKYNKNAEHSFLEEKLAKQKAAFNLKRSQLELILSDEYWNFEKNWYKPSIPTLEKLVKDIHNDIRIIAYGKISKVYEEQLFETMIEYIKNIEVVSLILAFLLPKHYGIISPPPEQIIGFRRHSNPVETLKTYLADLREIGERYRMKVFDVEKALWVIYQFEYKVVNYDKMLRKKLLKRHSDDHFLLRIRSRNLLKDIWTSEIDDSYKSEILMDLDPTVALIIAVRQIEYKLWESIVKTNPPNRIKELKDYSKSSRGFMSRLLDLSKLDPQLKRDIHSVWLKRNKSIHSFHFKNHQLIDQQDVRSALNLIKEINYILD